MMADWLNKELSHSIIDEDATPYNQEALVHMSEAFSRISVLQESNCYVEHRLECEGKLIDIEKERSGLLKNLDEEI